MSIPVQTISTEPPGWQQLLRDVVTDATELLQLLNLDAASVGYSEQAASQFTLKVPRAFISRMRLGDPEDPLLRQVLAYDDELLEAPGFTSDPVGEVGTANTSPGVIQKYHGRALLIASSSCAVNCRYCFRRHFPYHDNRVARSQWRDQLQPIACDPSITEIILSGGDPLMLGDAQLSGLVDLIAEIPHIRTLRIHTRLPVVIPDRVTRGLIEAITRSSLRTVVVLHCNHAREIDSSVEAATERLNDAGIHLLNQSVLLAGVNDSTEALVALSHKLFEARILPYYIHLLDKVAGAAHFDVSESRARELLSDTGDHLPGYLVPRLVKEISGAGAKHIIEPG